MTEMFSAADLAALASNPDAQRKFWRRTSSSKGHVVWKGYSDDGVPRWEFMGRRYSARRVFWALTGNIVENNLQLVRTCDVPECISHIQPAKSPQSVKTRCVNGHELTPDNIAPYIPGERACLTCHRARSRAGRARARARKRAAEDAALIGRYIERPVTDEEARRLAAALLRTADAAAVASARA